MSPLAGSREHPAPFVCRIEPGVERRIETARDEYGPMHEGNRIVNLDAVPVERDLQAIEPPAGELRKEHDADSQCVCGLGVEIRVTAHEPRLVIGIVVDARNFSGKP